MRYIYIVIALLFGAFAISCSPSTATEEEVEESFEPYMHGKWLVVAPDMAEYQRDNQKIALKSDSASIDTLQLHEGMGMELTYIDYRKAMLTVFDSTESQIIYDHNMYFGDGTIYDFRIVTSPPNVTQTGGIRYIKTPLSVKCNEPELPLQELIYLEYYEDGEEYTSPPLKVYEIPVDGIWDTAYDLAC